MVVELGLYAVGLYLYVRNTAAKGRVGSLGFRALALLLLVIFLADSFGPPPSGEKTLAIFALTGWSVVAWAYWVDNHRQTTAR